MNIQLSDYYLGPTTKSYVPSRRKREPEPVKMKRPPAIYGNLPTYFGIGDQLHNKNLEPYKTGKGINSEYRFS